MEQPFDMFYSIAFERFELSSSRIRAGFDAYQNHIKEDISLIQYLIRLETSSNPVRNTNESRRGHSENH